MQGPQGGRPRACCGGRARLQLGEPLRRSKRERRARTTPSVFHTHVTTPRGTLTTCLHRHTHSHTHDVHAQSHTPTGHTCTLTLMTRMHTHDS